MDSNYLYVYMLLRRNFRVCKQGCDVMPQKYDLKKITSWKMLLFLRFYAFISNLFFKWNNVHTEKSENQRDQKIQPFGIGYFCTVDNKISK